jgi:Transposase DDE domain.
VKTFTTEFTSKNLTKNAGLVNLGKFADKIGLQGILDKRLTIKRGATADYEMSKVIVMLMMGVLAGAKHMSHLVILKADVALRKLFGWDLFPDASTFGKLFKKFDMGHCHELSNAEAEARKRVWSKKWFPRITLDMDSTVIGVTGSQEGAEKGYNPKKKGQKSYHPLLCFIAETTECLHNWFRCGSAYTSNGVVEFMKECYDRIPQRVSQIFVRADSGFFDGNLLDFLEDRHSEYLIKVKMMKNLMDLLTGRITWTREKGKTGIETAEFMHKCHSWKKERRFVAVRKLVSVQTEGVFFPVPQYEFFCYVTNVPSTPWYIHKLYGQRATSENWISWCKSQMASGTIRTDSFWANSAIFQSCILAYNLMVWMMWLTSEKKSHEEPETIRSWFIHVPATVVKTARRLILKLSEHYAFKQEWEGIEKSLSALSFA